MLCLSGFELYSRWVPLRLTRCCSWRPSSRAAIAWDFSTLLASNKDKWVSSFLKTMPSEIGFSMTLTSGAFLNQKRNKQTSHELQKNLHSSCIKFCTSRNKKAVKNITRWHKTLSASAISKQVSRRCIDFPHELTYQILTNESIKLDVERDQRVITVRKVKRDCLPRIYKAGWIFVSEVSLKSKF